MCKNILVSLKAGLVQEAKVILDDLLTQKGQLFTNTFAIKSIIIKICLLVL
jgi:hypothetical protein